jgi:nicotinamide riboside kinase
VARAAAGARGTVTRGRVVALLGAESTGKSVLSLALRDALVGEGHDSVAVPEYLREFCDREGRTPRRDEQRAIAAEQTRRIEAAAAVHAVVIADTTALMIAVYSDQVFGDSGLYAEAEAWQRRCCTTLLTALDLPWQADSLQRDGPHVREPVDLKVRAALERAGCAWTLVEGFGEARTRAALSALRPALGAPLRPA